ncbi:hypothetical protein HI914_03937 [Erysiphe necator]|nr:hypothetical protein HI914_03937 [Erysiphe necator]
MKREIINYDTSIQIRFEVGPGKGGWGGGGLYDDDWSVQSIDSGWLSEKSRATLRTSLPPKPNL